MCAEPHPQVFSRPGFTVDPGLASDVPSSHLSLWRTPPCRLFPCIAMELHFKTSVSKLHLKGTYLFANGPNVSWKHAD